MARRTHWGLAVISPFYQKLQRAWKSQNSLLCVGLDPDRDKLPQHLRGDADAYLEFCRAIIDATAPYVCAFKPQAAHFSAFGQEQQLAELIRHIKANHPQLPVILDAKRGDVGSTAAFYAAEAFERYQADAVTLNPYLGPESIQPYLDYPDRGVVILCRTSNPDSDWLQALPTERGLLYQHVAISVAAWPQASQCMLVAGATYPAELRTIRESIGDMPLLVPGVGAQGGSVEAVLRAGMDQYGTGLVVSSSRQIIYASAGEDYAEAAAVAAKTLRNEMNVIRRQLVNYA